MNECTYFTKIHGRIYEHISEIFRPDELLIRRRTFNTLELKQVTNKCVQLRNISVGNISGMFNVIYII